jgi:hypothetical protein
MSAASGGPGAGAASLREPTAFEKKSVTASIKQLVASANDEADIDLVPRLDMEEDITQVLTVADSEIVRIFFIFYVYINSIRFNYDLFLKGRFGKTFER